MGRGTQTLPHIRSSRQLMAAREEKDDFLQKCGPWQIAHVQLMVLHSYIHTHISMYAYIYIFCVIKNKKRLHKTWRREVKRRTQEVFEEKNIGQILSKYIYMTYDILKEQIEIYFRNEVFLLPQYIIKVKKVRIYTCYMV